MLWHSKRPNAVSLRLSAIPKGTEKGKNKIWPREVLNPLLHFLSPQASPPYFSMCPLRVILGRDLVAFECPIKRRRWVRAPAWVLCRHVADEQAAAVSTNPVHLRAHTFLPPSDSFSCLLPPSVQPRFLHKHTSLHGKRSPASLIAAYLWSRRLWLFDPWLQKPLPAIHQGLDAAY